MCKRLFLAWRFGRSWTDCVGPHGLPARLATPTRAGARSSLHSASPRRPGQTPRAHSRS